jgi:hypothetical protein
MIVNKVLQFPNVDLVSEKHFPALVLVGMLKEFELLEEGEDTSFYNKIINCHYDLRFKDAEEV